MSDQIPKSIKILKALLIIRLSLIALLIVAFIVVQDTDPSQHSFASGLKQGIAARFEIGSLGSAEQIGYIFGRLSFAIFFTMAILAYIKTRQFKIVLTIVIIDLVFGFGNGFPIFQIIILIIVLGQSAKNYLKNIPQQNTEPDTP
jgi:hypothetical protein